MNKLKKIAGLFFAITLVANGHALADCNEENISTEKPDNIVALSSVAPGIIQKMRYATGDNFLGRPVTGYNTASCYLTAPAAEALASIQKELEEEGLGLLVFDCYRPQRAVNDFMVWAAGPTSPTKGVYFPNVPQTELIPQGYIAECSGHSRGSTVDLTLIKTGSGGEEKRGCDGSGSDELNMGTGYDCFDPLSETTHPETDIRAKRRRMRLASIMERHGFKNYSKEWWHYTFKPELYPDTYFDFPIE